MYCKSCGKQIDNDSTFCSFCGTKHNISIDTPKIKPVVSENIITKETPIQQTVENETETIISKEKYDLTYNKEIRARTVGIIILVANIIFIIFFKNIYSDHNKVEAANKILGVLMVTLRIVTMIWVTRIAKDQNRNETGWRVLAFFFPAITLIIIGGLNKLNKESVSPPNNFQKSENNNNHQTEVKLSNSSIFPENERKKDGEEIKKETNSTQGSDGKEMYTEKTKQKELEKLNIKTELDSVNIELQKRKEELLNLKKHQSIIESEIKKLNENSIELSLKYKNKFELKDYPNLITELSHMRTIISNSNMSAFYLMLLQYVKKYSIEVKLMNSYKELAESIISGKIQTKELQNLFKEHKDNDTFITDMEHAVRRTLFM